MRVTGGRAGGLALRTPDRDTRPTMDVVRQGLFASLGEAVVGARVLDLFAGSGALGIEALSRGAAEAVLVDSNRRAGKVIRENLERCGLVGRVVVGDVFHFLRRPPVNAAEQFDFIFADPPWAMRQEGEGLSDTERLVRMRELPAWLITGGSLYLEESREWAIGNPWHLVRVRRYGNTFLHRLIVAESAQGAGNG